MTKDDLNGEQSDFPWSAVGFTPLSFSRPSA
jgi:hypothetical protein